MANDFEPSWKSVGSHQRSTSVKEGTKIIKGFRASPSTPTNRCLGANDWPLLVGELPMWKITIFHREIICKWTILIILFIFHRLVYPRASLYPSTSAFLPYTSQDQTAFDQSIIEFLDLWRNAGLLSGSGCSGCSNCQMLVGLGI